MKPLIDLALKAQKHAHAPYSNFHVGAAVKAEGQNELFAGCNVENASYGATVCAERVAIFNMVAALGQRTLEAVVVVTNTSPPSPPCALCLQVMSEFTDDCEIILVNPQGETLKHRFKEFLPMSFDKKNLGE